MEGGTVRTSYVEGNINGEDYVGGLVGWNNGMIGNSYSTGNTEGHIYVGGLVGYSFGTVANSFWDVDQDGIEGTESGDDNFGATGKTTAGMKTKSTFTDAGWDFDDIWDINALNGGYLFLRLQRVPSTPGRRRPSPSPEPGPSPNIPFLRKDSTPCPSRGFCHP